MENQRAAFGTEKKQVRALWRPSSVIEKQQNFQIPAHHSLVDGTETGIGSS